MVVFDDTAPIDKKLMLYPHQISWKDGVPVPEKKEGSPIELSKSWEEPLTSEGRAFINAINGQHGPTDGQEGLKVLKVLQRAQASMDNYSHPSQKKSLLSP